MLSERNIENKTSWKVDGPATIQGCCKYDLPFVVVLHHPSTGNMSAQLVRLLVSLFFMHEN